MAKTIGELVQSLVSDLISKRNEKIDEKVTEASASVINEINKDELATKAELTDLASKSDLRDLAKKSELNDFATKSEISDLAKKSDIPSAYDDSDVKSSISSIQDSLGEKADKNDLFKDGKFHNVVTSDGDITAELWNESSGGGARTIIPNKNLKSFVGVNNADVGKTINGEEMDLMVQMYAINDETKVGTRINVSPTQGMFYLKGSSNTLFSDKTREVAVVGDINEAKTNIINDNISPLIERIAQLEAKVATLEGVNKPVDNTEEP